MRMTWMAMAAAAAWAAGAGANGPATSGSLEVELTIQGDFKAFAPRHVAAVWVETADGQFVRTLRVFGKKQQKRLEAWRSASGGKAPDAVTGATLTEWGRVTAAWDGTDADGRIVPDGVYRVRVESTWANSAGPQWTGEFKKGAAPDRPATPDVGSYRGIRLAWKPTAK